MTTYVEARDALVTHLNTGFATYPTMPVFWENTKQVDLASVVSPFVRVEINFTDCVDLTMNDIPIDEDTGEVSISILYKEGEGTRAGLALWDFLKPYMKHKSLSGVKTYTPHPGRKQESAGWVLTELVVPFSFNSLD